MESINKEKTEGNLTREGSSLVEYGTSDDGLYVVTEFDPPRRCV